MKEGSHRQIQRVRQERYSLTNLLEKSQLTIHDAGLRVAKATLELATSAESQWKEQSPYLRREILGRLLSNPMLDGVTVRYELQKRFRTLSEMRGNENWRTQIDEFRNGCLEAA